MKWASWIANPNIKTSIREQKGRGKARAIIQESLRAVKNTVLHVDYFGPIRPGKYASGMFARNSMNSQSVVVNSGDGMGFSLIAMKFADLNEI